MDLLIFLALAAVFVLGLRHFLKRLRAKETETREQVRAMAKRNRWEYDADSKNALYTVRGATEGVHWRVIADLDAGSSDPSPSTTWSTDDIAYPDLVGIIRTRKGYEMLQGTFGRAASGLLHAMTVVIGLPSPQHAELIKSGLQLTARSSLINEEFVVIIRDDRRLNGLLTPAVESALAAWAVSGVPAAQKDSLNIDVGQWNLRVYCRWVLAPEHLEQFVSIGTAIAAALRTQLQKSV